MEKEKKVRVPKKKEPLMICVSSKKGGEILVNPLMIEYVEKEVRGGYCEYSLFMGLVKITLTQEEYENKIKTILE